MLHVHRAERADGLVGALRELLADPAPGDPFAPELVCVPTRGMERWLTQQLAGGLGASPGRGDGVCANVDFPSPRRLCDDAVAVAAGIDPAEDVWLPERLVWPLLEVVDASLEEPWLRALAAHLGGEAARRFASVRHIAELFDRYALLRPEMVRGWAAGRNELPADARWQAELWRRLRERVGQPDPAARVAGACERLRADPGLVALPERLSLFGLTRLPAARLEVLRALAHARDVHLFLLHPSPALWEKVAREGDALRVNRLLASWGRDAHELQLVIGAAADADHHHPTPPRADSLLARVQEQVRLDERPPGEPLPGAPDERLELAEGDRSIEVHSCHGRARQVEVLRDAILHLLACDPSLEPRDIIVMCPDVEAFAPLIGATFGAAEEGEGELPDLRVRLADRSLRQTNPVLGFVARLLELADQRLTASQVLDLADREPVRRRFGLDDDDVARLEEWVPASGVRWGLDAAHRAPFKLDRLEAGTWRFGLDRLLLGVAMAERDQALFAGVLPLDDVESRAVDLAGRLAELIDRLGAAIDSMHAPLTAGGWAAVIAGAADALTATGPRDAWQRAELQRLLDDVVREAAVGGAAETELSLGEVRALLADRLAGRPTRANFRTGHLTICTLVPMRSVPHRVVCLLGLDDGEFPRKAPRDGDDLVLRAPRVGDRDARAEDRQMLLDALMAATDRLIVTYTGKDERTNTPRPPAVPVGELLEVVEATARGDVRDRVLVQHPLQPFDPRNFIPGALVPERPWGFERTTLVGARALTAPRKPLAPFLPGPLPGEPPALVELDDLVRFVEHPVRAFLRKRLGLSLWEDEDEGLDALAVEMGPLERSRVGRRLLEGRMGGAALDACVAAERARGLLPPGLLGDSVLGSLGPEVEAVATRALGLASGEASAVDVRVTLGDGTVVGGTVGDVHGSLLRVVRFARVRASHRIGLYVRWLALCATGPYTATLVGRAASARDGEVGVTGFGELAPEQAIRRLEVLVDLYRRGLREPLPLGCATAAAYAQSGEVAAERAWESTWNFPREDKDAEHQLAFGGVLTFAQLRSIPPHEGEVWGDEPSRFGQLARRMWKPLLALEQAA